MGNETNKTGSEAKVLMDYAYKKFVDMFNQKPYYSKTEFAISMKTLKNLLNKYSKKEIKGFIKEFYKLDEQFLKDVGYKIRFLPSKLNSLMVKQKVGNGKGKDYTKTNYKSSISDKQLYDYLKMKKNNDCTGEESWAQEYEDEIDARDLTLKKLKRILDKE